MCENPWDVVDEPAACSWRLQEEAAAGGRGACAHKKGVTFEIGALNFLASDDQRCLL